MTRAARWTAIMALLASFGCVSAPPEARNPHLTRPYAYGDLTSAEHQKRLDWCKASWVKKGFYDDRIRVFGLLSHVGPGDVWALMEAATTHAPHFYAYLLVVNGQVIGGSSQSGEDRSPADDALLAAVRAAAPGSGARLESGVMLNVVDASCWFVTVGVGDEVQQFAVLGGSTYSAPYPGERERRLVQAMFPLARVVME